MKARRLLTVPAIGVATILVTVASPALALAAIAIDVARALVAKRRWTATRVLAFVASYLVAESIGILALSATWALAGVGAGRAARLVELTYGVQRAWAGALYTLATRIFSLRIDVEGDACATPGPILVLVRHASLIDTLLPTRFITARHGLRLRFVLKRELLVDPCLDIAGHRIPNVFVARSGVDTDAELARVRELATGLGPNEGVLIYPEGTRFSKAKRARALAALDAKSSPYAEAARALVNVLPPRLGGPLALLDAAPNASVVIVAHTGLEPFAEAGDILRGDVIGLHARVKLWRIPREQIPSNPDDRARWLFAAWADVDAWISEGS